MKKRRQKSYARSIRMTPEANAYLNSRAEQLGLSAGEYSRRMMFLEAWDGIVFDDVRAIDTAAAAAIQSKSIEAYLPYGKAKIERLRQGKEEVQQLRKFVLECILPALDEAEGKITATLQQQEQEVRNLASVQEMANMWEKFQGGSDS